AVLFALGETRSFPLAGGSDGLPPVGTDQNLNTQSVADALEVLEDIEDIAIIASPGHSTLVDGTFRTIQGQLIGHAERMQYRFAVLDTPPALTPGAAREVRSRIDSYRAAIYYPWIVISNPAARPGDDSVPKEIALPPSGFVTGIYARNDVSRGVWKAPANEIVRGALRFEREVNKGQQETLNPEGVNCLRFFFGRGNRIWGARTASSDPEWMYVNVVRYFIYLEHSIDRSTQWAVFEPNGERLWANITDTVSAFLFNEWRSGALLGSTPDQAYFVRCDRSTMTQADLDNGRLICEIGVAALKPAEFVIFRIGQKTADA
ncbi:MAG: phage tail sheath family protein, partial [Rhizobiales bacterium]|nr:phage tail sheath family protein [Hyphomicrobiales bacterium]